MSQETIVQASRNGQQSAGPVAAVPGADQLARTNVLHYTTTCGPEDRATLRSDPSAGPADGVAGQGGRQTDPAHAQTPKGATLSSKR
jgi:hypothetical protein